MGQVLNSHGWVSFVAGASEEPKPISVSIIHERNVMPRTCARSVLCGGRQDHGVASCNQIIIERPNIWGNLGVSISSNENTLKCETYREKPEA